MQQFTTKKNGFRALRKKLLISLIISYGLGVVVMVLFSTTNTPGEQDDNSLLIKLMIVALVFAFSTYSTLKRQKKMFESYRLTITDDSVIREQHNTPTITIPKNTINEITRTAAGMYCIVGESKLNAIVIPAQIEDPDDLERLLAEIKPITMKASGRLLQYFQITMIVLIFAVICMGLLSESRIILTLSGTAMCALLIWGFVIIRHSRNTDRRMKRLSYLTVIPFLAILANVIIQWLET